MPPSFYFYWPFHAFTCGYALWRGHSDARVSAIVCIVASIVSPMILTPVTKRYSGVETGELIIDAAVLLAFIFVALRSERFWPLWIAGLQLTSSTAHLLKSIDLELLPYAYAAAAKLWSYPILLIIAVGAWRGRRRALAQHGIKAVPN